MSNQPTTAGAVPALTALDTSQSAHMSAHAVIAQPASPGKYSTAHSPAGISDVESPSLSTPSARARFEFEHGRANEGTKVLMVEWEDDAVTRRARGTWRVDWDGKPPGLMPVPDDDVCNGAESAVSRSSGRAGVSVADEDEAYYSTSNTPSTAHVDTPAVAGRSNGCHRVFFLLGPRLSVPAIVTLTLTPDTVPVTGSQNLLVEWRTNPLPAIFPKSLADATGAHCAKGVLHGIWARKRLAQLDKEIDEEAKINCEGIALHMAVSEKEWIVATYGLSPATTSIREPLALKTVLPSAEARHAPSSPLSPGGTRLSERLKGLRLQVNESTSPTAPSQATTTTQPVRTMPILPPSMHSTSAHGTDTYHTSQTSPSLNAILAAAPPPRLAAQSKQTSTSSPHHPQPATGPATHHHEDDEEAQLFALPLSPRSPEMRKSPFSFVLEDTLRYTTRHAG